MGFDTVHAGKAAGFLVSPGVVDQAPEHLSHLWEKTSPVPAKCLAEMITLENICQMLENEGYDLSEGGIAICLEPESEMRKKLEAGKADEIWCAFIRRHPSLRVPVFEIKRAKGDLFRIFMAWDANGYSLPMIEEEPGATKAKVGHFILETYEGAFVVTMAKDTFGRIHPTIPGGSLTRGGEVPANAKLLGFYYTNFRRIVPDKPIAIYVVEMEDYPEIDNSGLGKKPKKGWDPENLPVGYKKLMHYTKVLEESHDARTLAAVAIYLGTLLGKNNKHLIRTLSNLAQYTEMSVEETAAHVGLSATEQKVFEEEMAVRQLYM